MSIIAQIRLQARIQAGKVLHDPESIPFEVWGEAYVIQDYANKHLLVICEQVKDQIDEDLEIV